MSLSSRESKLAQHREALLQLNAQLFLIISERRAISLKVQELKEISGRYSHFDPERENLLFQQMASDIKGLTVKELLAFSLIMEDQATAMAPGSYPTWSAGVHLEVPGHELTGMINPLLLKTTHPLLFERLKLNADFTFLKQF